MRSRAVIVIIGVVILVATCVHAQTGNIDSTYKWAWGTNIGWINFNPTDGGVTIDPITGSFEGDAWAENVGWIRFKNTEPGVIFNVAATSVIAVTSGDVNGDGVVDLLDARLCLQIATGHFAGAAWQRTAADVDHDGDVDMTDAEILADYVLGVRSALP